MYISLYYDFYLNELIYKYKYVFMDQYAVKGSNNFCINKICLIYIILSFIECPLLCSYVHLIFNIFSL